jgi:aspartate racemase
MNAAKTLVNAGAEVLAVPCVTAHFFYERITKAVPVPVLHIAEETAKRLRKNGVHTAGLLATDGTVSSQLFHKVLAKYDMDIIVPGSENQHALMDLIYRNIKKGIPADPALFERLADDLRERGAETVILGCTELSWIIKEYFTDRPAVSARFTDALDVLARAALVYCGGEVASGYE